MGETSKLNYSDCIAERAACRAGGAFILGVLPGEGVGPEIVEVALSVLEAVQLGEPRLEIRRFTGTPSGDGQLDEKTATFCAQTFADGGVLLAGAMGGRFVYDLRRRFHLFCKLSPVRVWDELAAAGRMKPAAVAGVDMLLVRENCSGLYQGEWTETGSPSGGRRIEHRFCYAEEDVRAIVQVAARIASGRKKKLAVVVKDGGVPGISQLWRDCAEDIAAAHALSLCVLNVDYAAYRLVQEAREFDVVVAPNLFGDVLADLAGVLLGSRAITFSGNFAANGAAVYQTNHGAALDLTGTDRANPVGQILSLAMLLRESFALEREAHLIESAVRCVWREGWTTGDLDLPGGRLVGMRELALRIAEAARRLANQSPLP